MFNINENSINFEYTIAGKTHFFSKDDIMCSNCGTYYGHSKNFYIMNNGDFVCSKKCFREYCEPFFELTKFNITDCGMDK